jgi:hypothetical protein
MKVKDLTYKTMAKPKKKNKDKGNDVAHFKRNDIFEFAAGIIKMAGAQGMALGNLILKAERKMVGLSNKPTCIIVESSEYHLLSVDSDFHYESSDLIDEGGPLLADEVASKIYEFFRELYLIEEAETEKAQQEKNLKMLEQAKEFLNTTLEPTTFEPHPPQLKIIKEMDTFDPDANKVDLLPPPGFPGRLYPGTTESIYISETSTDGKKPDELTFSFDTDKVNPDQVKELPGRLSPDVTEHSGDEGVYLG